MSFYTLSFTLLFFLFIDGKEKSFLQYEIFHFALDKHNH